MEQNKVYIIERHLKTGYPCLFKDLPNTEIWTKEPVAACTDIYCIIVTGKTMDELTKMTRDYLLQRIGSFEFSPYPEFDKIK